MTMRRHDLNLVPVLDALLRHKNVTRAGQELGLSQSATSHALTRLRDQFDDRLLIASGNELLLTHRAESMTGLLADTMQMLEKLLEIDDFDPALVSRRFKIATADYVAHLILPSLIREITSTAPSVTVQVAWDNETTAARLRDGQLDIALLPRGSIESSDLHVETLYADDLVAIAALDHPEIGDTLDLQTFMRLPYAAFRREDAPEKSFADRQLQQNQLSPREAVLVSDFLVLGFVVASTQCVSLLPRRVAEKLRDASRLRIFQAPFATEQLHIQAYWSHKAHSDGGNRWFRDILAQVCSGL